MAAATLPAVPPVLPSLWSSTDYALDWPATLLRDELLALRSNPYAGWRVYEVVELLELAFHDGAPVHHFRAYVGSFDQEEDPMRASQWIDDLIEHADQLLPYVAPAARWRDRTRGVTRQARLEIRHRFLSLVMNLSRHGYFGRDTVEACRAEPDDDEDHRPDLATRVGALMNEPGFWRPSEMFWEELAWDNDTFYELIEVFHDLAARPRQHWHSANELCIGHYHDFDTDSGRRIYRALVNRLLAEHGIELRLAAHGPDEGRLVELVDEARADLIDRALQSPDVVIGERVKHAIAQFRDRAATEHDKRSAVLTLVGVLEERRGLIRTEIGRKDEGALFTLANEFAIRHQRRGQQDDYDPAFLDWMFWWYLEIFNGEGYTWSSG